MGFSAIQIASHLVQDAASISIIIPIVISGATLILCISRYGEQQQRKKWSHLIDPSSACTTFRTTAKDSNEMINLCLIVPHALLRAVSRLVSTHSTFVISRGKRRDDSRRGTHECVRYERPVRKL